MTQALKLLSILIISTLVQSNIKIPKKIKNENQERNSPELNNFLKEVLSAKDELKWIDQMIYPRVTDHKYPHRRLLARNTRSVDRKNYWGYDDYEDDEDDDYQDYLDTLTDKRRRFNLNDDLDYDDNGTEEKCETLADRGILIKKMNNKTKYVEPKTVFLTPEDFNSEKFYVKRDYLRDLQDDDDDYQEDYDETQYRDDYMEEFDDKKYKRTVKDDDDVSDYLDDIPFDLSPEVGNTSSSGSDYHALKATDDMFKGGIEQGNSYEDRIEAYKKIPELDEKITLPPYLKKSKWFSNLKLSQRADGKVKNTSTDNREKRLSVKDMPIMHHESIVEPSNWPWEYYDDKDDMRIKFGRGLMQVSNDKFSGTVKKRKNMRMRNLKFINSTNLSHSQKKSNFLLEHNRLKKHLNRISFPYEKSQRNKKFKVTRFAREAENEDKDKDVSQIHFRVNGKLADEIVDKIFEEVEQNEYLKDGLTFQRSNKSDIAAKSGNDTTAVEEDQTVEAMKTVKQLLQTIIKSELDKRTCMKLPPCLEEFLTWLVENQAATAKAKEPSDSEENKAEQRKVLFPINLKPPENPSKDSSEKSLIAKSAVQVKSVPIDSSKIIGEENTARLDQLFGKMHEKMKLLKRLLKAYHSLSFDEQRKVKAVHDYLRKQLKALEKFEKLKETISDKLPSNNLMNYKRENSLHSHVNDNSLLTLFSEELTHRNKLRDLKEQVEKMKKLKKKSLNDSRHKRAMKVIEKLSRTSNDFSTVTFAPTFNNINNQIKMTSIAKINEITNSSEPTMKNSLVTLKSAKLLESKINIFPVGP